MMSYQLLHAEPDERHVGAQYEHASVLRRWTKPLAKVLQTGAHSHVGAGLWRVFIYRGDVSGGQSGRPDHDELLGTHCLGCSVYHPGEHALSVQDQQRFIDGWLRGTCVQP